MKRIILIVLVMLLTGCNLPQGSLPAQVPTATAQPNFTSNDLKLIWNGQCGAEEVCLFKALDGLRSNGYGYSFKGGTLIPPGTLIWAYSFDATKVINIQTGMMAGGNDYQTLYHDEMVAYSIYFTRNPIIVPNDGKAINISDQLDISTLTPAR